MRSWQIQAFGFKDAREHGLRLVELDDPEPGPGQILVGLKAWSINYRDLRLVEGSYNRKQPLPCIPLSDGAGEVLAVGPGVTRCAVGDRVMTTFFQGWTAGRPDRDRLKTALASPLPGVASDKVVLSAEGVTRIPSHLDLAEAATLPCAGLTAWSALEQAGTKSGDVVVVQGSGGVSVFALAFAKARGARVIATSKSADKRTRLEALGANMTISYLDTPDWGTVIKRKLTDGGADHVVEIGGVGTLAQSIEAVRPDGVVSVIGVVTGAAGSVNLMPVLMQNIRLQGVIVGSRDAQLDMVRGIETTGLRPAIGQRFAFAELPRALESMAKAEHFGKIVLEAQS